MILTLKESKDTDVFLEKRHKENMAMYKEQIHLFQGAEVESEVLVVSALTAFV